MYKLVLIDDELHEIKQIERLIHRITEEFDVISFTNSFVALNYIKSNKTDVIVTDIRMPNMDGISLIKEISRINADIKIIILSGYAEFDYAKEAMSCGVKYYLEKPISKGQLARAFEEILDELQKNKYLMTASYSEKYIEFLEDICIGWFDSTEDMKAAFENQSFPFSIEEAFGYVISIEVKGKEYSDKYEKGIMNVLTDVLNGYVYGFYNKDRGYTYFVFKGEVVDTEFIEKTFSNMLGVDVSVTMLEKFSSLEDIDGQKIYSADSRLEMLISKIIANDNISDKKIIRRIVNEFKKKSVDRNHKNRETFYGIFNDQQQRLIKDICEEMELQFTTSNQMPVDIAKKYIEENYNREITWEKVAKIVNMNPSYFSRYFRKKTGMGFHEYLVKYRIEKVKEIILSNKTMEQIAIETGFFDVRTMRRNFRALEGMTMSEYKKKYKL